MCWHMIWKLGVPFRLEWALWLASVSGLVGSVNSILGCQETDSTVLLLSDSFLFGLQRCVWTAAAGCHIWIQGLCSDLLLFLYEYEIMILGVLFQDRSFLVFASVCGVVCWLSFILETMGPGAQTVLKAPIVNFEENPTGPRSVVCSRSWSLWIRFLCLFVVVSCLFAPALRLSAFVLCLFSAVVCLFHPFVSLYTGFGNLVWSVYVSFLSSDLLSSEICVVCPEVFFSSFCDVVCFITIMTFSCWHPPLV